MTKKSEDKEQSKRFIETAKKLGADGSDEAFERAIEIILPPKKSKPSEHS